METLIHRIKRWFRLLSTCKKCESKWECRIKRNHICYVIRKPGEEFKRIDDQYEN